MSFIKYLLILMAFTVFNGLALAQETSPRYVDLKISPERINGHIVPNDRNFGIFRTDVEYAEHSEFLGNISKPLGDVGDELRIQIKTPNGWSTLQIPKEADDRILKYIAEGSGRSQCDCNCFGHFVANVPFAFGTTKPSDWNHQLLESEGQLSPGDVLFMLKPDNQISHVVVYLGEGLYLSKLGVDGNLAVTNFKEIAYAYEAESAYFARPKTTQNFDSAEAVVETVP